ncbi:MAG: tetratricopeptide repeat protein [Candidatus Dasytiphilus stammeri]
MEQHLLYQNKKLFGYVLVLILTLSFSGGLLWYKKHQLNDLEQASIIYHKMLKNNPVAAEDFINYHNIYSTLISLNLAKQSVEKQDFYQAELQLKIGLKNISDVNLQTIVKLRLARIQLQQKKIDEALDILKTIKGITWTDIVAELQGDAWFSKGNFYQAYQSWYNCMAATNSPIMKQIMKLKMNNLPKSINKSFTS